MLELIIGGFLLTAAGGLGVAWRLSDGQGLRRSARRALRHLKEETGLAAAPLEEARGSLERAARDYVEQRQRERLERFPLREAGARNVRFGPLEEAGLEHLADLDGWSERRLVALPGFGRVSASRLLEAARDMRAALAAEPVPMPTTDLPDEASRDLVAATRTALQARDTIGPVAERLQREHERGRQGLAAIRKDTTFLRWLFGGHEGREARVAEREARALLERLDALEETFRDARRLRAHLADSVRQLPAPEDLERDYRARHADYAAMLVSLLAGSGSGALEPATLQGGLPEEIARRVEAYELHLEGLRATLRGYQSFGTRYLLAQRRSVLGDEMGLGKTMQALAAMVHLGNENGDRRFLVVCPASITRNWIREAGQRTDLQTLLIQGDGWEDRLEQWLRDGGLAVTSFATCRSGDVDGAVARSSATLDLLVVDEAHYVKNPDSGRTQAVAAAAGRSRNVCLMTGTPLENRLEDFRNIVRIASPELGSEMPESDPGLVLGSGASASLQRLVAPVYLRRNQKDVLAELPERIEKEEWVDFSPSDEAAYRAAVAEGNYMAMRRTATMGDGLATSAKLERLGELLDEYRESGRKVLVFSFFLDVLDAVGRSFPSFGPVRGSVSQKERMALIDAFTTAEGHQLLLAQIIAGGVGLNLQSASVVVLMEPQWKPSTEDQAIARAHRMGQTEHVIVHRLLARDSVDERLVEVLQGKRELFEEYARKSAVKDASSLATETGFAAAVVAAEAARLAA